jgi:hypothetical protein
MKIVESIKRHPYRTVSAAALVLGIVAGETIGYAQNPIDNVPEGDCVSPLAVSKTYIEPGTSTLLQTRTGMFTTGLVAREAIPKGADGVQVSFKSPEANAAEWDKNASGMIKADEVGKVVLKMAIGDGEVQFGVRTVAPAGSSLCNTPPEVTYEHLDQGAYFSEHAIVPWRNPVNVVTNIF